jgi:DNA-binding transcriptional LysR family regulator
MTMADPSWELWRSFLAVMRERSLSGAARALALTQPTIGRHIDGLEAALGLVLFTRSPQGLVATDAAEALLPEAEAMAAAAEALLRLASGAAEAERGTVRLTASEIFAAEVLPPILARFRDRHPGIVLELVATNRIENLLRRDADIAVRTLRPTQGAIVARRIGRVGLGLYAHRRYAEAHGLPQRLDELDRHQSIGFDRDAGSARSIGATPLALRRERFTFRCDNDVAQLAALRAGLGIGGAQHAIARRDPALLPVLPDSLRFGFELWLAMHEDLRASRRVRLLFDHLAAELAAYVASGGE